MENLKNSNDELNTEYNQKTKHKYIGFISNHEKIQN